MAPEAASNEDRSSLERVVIAPPAPRHAIAVVTAMRSAQIVSSLQLLRARGHFDRYTSLLRDQRSEIFSCVPGTWVSMATARAHYRACDALGLSEKEQVAMGEAAAQHARTGWIAQALRIVRASGVTPWSLVGYLDRMWQRSMIGGAVAVYRLGPKEARLEFIGCELFEIPYHRHAYRGLIDSLGAAFSQRHYTREVLPRAPNEAIFRTQWV